MELDLDDSAVGDLTKLDYEDLAVMDSEGWGDK